MVVTEAGGPDAVISDDKLKRLFLDALERLGPRRGVVIVPPDASRIHSLSGLLAEAAWEYYGTAIKAVLPALGTHGPMTADAVRRMFPAVPEDLFQVHDYRRDVVTAGRIPAEEVEKISSGRVRFDWPVQVNRLLLEQEIDLVLSVGQVVPHEVVGMANYTKNILIGTGGAEAIDKSHFLGAVCGLESIMGRTDTPVRELLNTGANRFLRDLPVVYGMTVREAGEDGTVTRGLFVGDDDETFRKAADLSRRVNITFLEEPAEKIVVYLDPEEYRSTWIGNKAIYRTRMAAADGGEVVILAPGVREFGEAPELDRLIRRYGYPGTGPILEAVREDTEFGDRLSAAAHCIHGSTEGRFSVTYCTGGLSKSEIEAAGYLWADPAEMLERYGPDRLKQGFNTLPGGELVFSVANPGLGLWAERRRFESSGG